MQDCITIAMAKGRTAKKALQLLKAAGISFPHFNDETRKLIFYDQTNQYRMIYVKAVDVPTYVEQGAADIGIVGKDNIMEQQKDIYELIDLKFGNCSFCIAGLKQLPVNEMDGLTVASKYPTMTKAYFQEIGVHVQTIKLNGSVELAPLIGLADVIVDIVETGTTLKENGLQIIGEIAPISTRLIVNKASFATKTTQIHAFTEQIKQVLEGEINENSHVR